MMACTSSRAECAMADLHLYGLRVALDYVNRMRCPMCTGREQTTDGMQGRELLLV